MIGGFLTTVSSERDGYILPFVHSSVNIFQGYNGQYSHKQYKLCTAEFGVTQDDRFSLDFQLPFGTPVRAARSGTVYFAVDSYIGYYNGLDFKKGMSTWTNHLYLVHSDTSFTLYSHLGYKCLGKWKGSFVEQGEVIAETGPSGWIGPMPHLHFSAGFFDPDKFPSRLVRRTFPVHFDDYTGALDDEKIELEKILLSY